MQTTPFPYICTRIDNVMRWGQRDLAGANHSNYLLVTTHLNVEPYTSMLPPSDRLIYSVYIALCNKFSNRNKLKLFSIRIRISFFPNMTISESYLRAILLKIRMGEGKDNFIPLNCSCRILYWVPADPEDEMGISISILLVNSVWQATGKCGNE